MDFNQLLGTLARSSAQAVSTLSRLSDDIEEFKKYLYVETDIEKEFIEVLESCTYSQQIIFLCGSSGDGKSELLRRHHSTYKERFRIHLDATHSFKPDQNAVEALDDLFDEHQVSTQPLIIGINVGMLFNYQNTGSARHNAIKEAIGRFIEGERSFDIYQFINFEDYPKFSIEEGQVGSAFVTELLCKVTTNTPTNPLYKAYEKVHEKDTQLHYHNYRLLQEPAVQQRIVRTLLQARLKFDQFFSARALLDFIHHLIANDAVLFDNLFASPGDGLAGSLVEFDPCLLRSQKLDQFVVQRSLNVPDSEFEFFKQSYCDKFGTQELTPSCWVRAFYILQDIDLGNNFHKQFAKDFTLPLFDEYIRVWQLHHSKDDRKQLRDFYNKQLIASLLKFANRLEPKIVGDGIYLNKRNNVVVSAEVEVRLDLKNIADANSIQHQIHSFYAAIKVNNSSIKPFPVTISFFELAQRILGGYRPNRHDKNAIVILEEFIEELVSISNKSTSIHFHKNDKEWRLILDDDEFIVEAC